MNNNCYKIKELDTGKIKDWSMKEILYEINRDHSLEFQDYDENDWLEGWDEWVEGEFYSRILDK